MQEIKYLTTPASWLCEYTRNTNPVAAKRNNTECARREIERAYAHFCKSFVDPADSKRVHHWMHEFRNAAMKADTVGKEARS